MSKNVWFLLLFVWLSVSVSVMILVVTFITQNDANVFLLQT